jgi:hypothetical protein
MQVTEYRSLFLHMEWAGSLVWPAALSAPAFRHDDDLRERMRLSFHPVGVPAAVQRLALEIPELCDLPDLGSVARWGRQLYRELPRFRDPPDNPTSRAGRSA